MDLQFGVDIGVWNQQKESYGNWIELMFIDFEVGFDFYVEMFGWVKFDIMLMGEMGNYQLFIWQGMQIGGMIGLGNVFCLCWLFYFGVNGVDVVIQCIEVVGGMVMYGLVEVLGFVFIVVVQDLNGVYFVIVGFKVQMV